MFTLFRRFVIRIFTSSPSQPPPPGSFTLEQIARIDYKETQEAPTPSPEAPAAAAVEEKQPTEGRKEDVAIPMQAVAVEKEVAIIQPVEEKPQDIPITTPPPDIPAATPQLLPPEPAPVALKEPSALVPTKQEQPRDLARAFQTVRPELNIEKHADFIFAPSHSKNLDKPRLKKWQVTAPDGTAREASLAVFPSSVTGKRPTTKTRKFFLAMQRVWEENGEDGEGYVLCSDYQLSQVLGLKWAGEKTIKEHEREADQLQSPIKWQGSFVDENGDFITIKDSFHILDNYRRLEKRDRQTKELYLALNKFSFSPAIRKNLQANRTKPTRLDVALAIKGEIASVLYAHLDIIMANKERYERTTEGLFSDLRLEDEDYRKPSHRKRRLETAIKELDGQPLSTGVLHLTLEKTKDGSDWKLVAKKTPLKKEHPKTVTGKLVEPANPPEAIPHLARELADTLGGYGQYRQLYEKLYKTYSAELVYQAMREWNADGGREAHRPLPFFLAILHRLAHQRGKLWIKPCPPDCKHLPKN